MTGKEKKKGAKKGKICTKPGRDGGKMTPRSPPWEKNQNAIASVEHAPNK
jgi:hypothetical protein